MKKIILACAVFCTTLLSSCVFGHDEPVSTTSISVPTVSLITTNGEKPISVLQYGSYNYLFDNIARTMAISTTLQPSLNDKIEVSGNPISFNANLANVNDALHEIFSGREEQWGQTSGGEKLTDLKFELTSVYNSVDYIDGLPAQSVPMYHTPNGAYIKYTVMNYNVGNNMSVKTLWGDMVFNGTNETRYPDAQGNTVIYANDKMQYRLTMNLKEMKGTVIIYGAKFAEMMPEIKAIVIEGLEIKLSGEGYVVSGINIVPKVLEGNKLVENAKYTISDFTMTSTGDLVGAHVNFNIGGRYNCLFFGRYLKTKAELEGDGREPSN